MEISDIRKRLKQEIAKRRAASAERRRRVDEAQRAYDAFLSRVATPVVRQFANALKAEGYSFRVFTPTGGLRLASERSPEDFIELALDTTGDEPAVIGRVSRGRGRRVVSAERPLTEAGSIDALTEEDVVQFLVTQIGPFVER
jgi:hypothetical protein